MSKAVIIVSFTPVSISRFKEIPVEPNDIVFVFDNTSGIYGENNKQYKFMHNIYNYKT